MSPPSFLEPDKLEPPPTEGETVGARGAAADPIASADSETRTSGLSEDSFPEPSPPFADSKDTAAALAAPQLPIWDKEGGTEPTDATVIVAPEVPLYDRFTPLRKRLIVVLVSFAALMGPLGTHFYNPALLTIAEEFDCSETLVNASVTVYSLVLAIAPLVWGPMSDRMGRRPVYLAAASVFVVGCLGCWFSINIYMLIAFRFLQGAGGSAVMSVGAGTIADIHRKEERGRAMGLYWVLPLTSPVISAPVGGVICEYLGWRYVFAVSLGLGSIIFLCILIFLPETLPASKRNAKKRPSMLAGIYALRHPFVAFVTLDACCLFAALWSLNSMLPFMYSEAYGLPTSLLGAAMAATAIGNLSGSVFGGIYADLTLIKWKRKRRGILVPEDRLRTTWMAGVFVPIGLLLFGWAPEKRLSISVAIIGQVLIGYGTLSATSSENTFLIDLYSESPASIVSANNCIRYLAASIMPVISPTGVANLGSGWFYTIVAVVKTIGTISVTWVSMRGARYRMKREPWSGQKPEPVAGWLEEWKVDVEKKRGRLEKWVGPVWGCWSGKPAPWSSEDWGGIPEDLRNESVDDVDVEVKVEKPADPRQSRETAVDEEADQRLKDDTETDLEDRSR